MIIAFLDETGDISRLVEEISCFLPLAFLDSFASLSGFFVLCHCLVVSFSHLGVLACLDQKKGKKTCNPSSIDMYNNDVGKKSAQKFMKQTGDLKAATLYFAS